MSAEQARAALDARGVGASVAFDGVVFGGLRLGQLTVLGGADDTGLNTVDPVQPLDEGYAARVLDRAVESTLRARARSGSSRRRTTWS